mmetsp:Transcript_17032/g.50834  ORF Transcript_17032/g.50834 Transcript_17032/m.50834 type:complete len:200 (-) Transcript_17032:366-965(-)
MESGRTKLLQAATPASPRCSLTARVAFAAQRTGTGWHCFCPPPWRRVIWPVTLCGCRQLRRICCRGWSSCPTACRCFCWTCYRCTRPLRAQTAGWGSCWGSCLLPVSSSQHALWRSRGGTPWPSRLRRSCWCATATSGASCSASPRGGWRRSTAPSLQPPTWRTKQRWWLRCATGAPGGCSAQGPASWRSRRRRRWWTP